MGSIDRTNASPLRVLIVGAGIGGLAAAISLRIEGHQVTIFERSRFASEIGAAVATPPNCVRALKWLGIDPTEHAATINEGTARFDADGNLLHYTNLREALKTSTEGWYTIHRAHLHTALKNRALSDTGPGPVPQLILSCTIIDLDTENPKITLSNGKEFTGDVIIGADGVHSYTRTYVQPDAHPVAKKTCVRWLAPNEDLAKDPQTEVFSKAKLPGTIVEVTGPDRRIIFYPCVNHTITNFAAFVPLGEMPTADSEQGWDAKGQKDCLLKAFSAFGPSIRALLAQAPEDDLKLWDLLDMETLSTFTKDSLALIGDAAHPFMPFMAQGGAMAIEDSIAVGAFMPLGTTREQVPARLQMYEKSRKKRVTSIQDFTRMNARDANDTTVARPTVEMMHNAIKGFIEHDERESAVEKLKQWTV